MAEKPVAPDQEGMAAPREEKPARSDEDFRALCRRYSQLRSRMPR